MNLSKNGILAQKEPKKRFFPKTIKKKEVGGGEGKEKGGF